MSLIETLNWRYAAKRMNGIKVPAAQLEQVLEAIRLTASSTGLQPYKVVVIENDEIKKKLQVASFNPQVQRPHTYWSLLHTNRLLKSILMITWT